MKSIKSLKIKEVFCFMKNEIDNSLKLKKSHKIQVLYKGKSKTNLKNFHNVLKIYQNISFIFPYLHK